jgi:two-component sensor histidine kinase
LVQGVFLRASSWIVLFGIWAVIGALLSVELYLTLRSVDVSVPFGSVAFGQAMRVFFWALLTPAVFALQRRLPIARETWWWAIPLHLAFGVLAMVLIYLTRLFVAFAYYDESLAGFWSRVTSEFYGRNLVDVAIYWTVFGAGYTVAVSERFRATEVRAARLEKDLAQAETKALKAQLHPHFLFNTLNTVSSLVREGQSREAVSLVARLASLLRLALETTGQQEVPLRQELDFLRRYLEIQQLRFPDRLRTEFRADPEILEARVPHLVLQPLVENAVVHGFSRRVDVGHVVVEAERVGDRLRLRVLDDGPGFARAAPSSGTGIGLANTRERLARLYLGDASLSWRDRPEGGAEVLVDLPFRTVS